MKLIQEFIESWFHQSRAFKAIMKILINRSKKHRHVFMSRETIAFWSGYSIRTVARVITRRS